LHSSPSMCKASIIAIETLAFRLKYQRQHL
jgi:hypothetical protein